MHPTRQRIVLMPDRFQVGMDVQNPSLIAGRLFALAQQGLFVAVVATGRDKAKWTGGRRKKEVEIGLWRVVHFHEAVAILNGAVFGFHWRSISVGALYSKRKELQ